MAIKWSAFSAGSAIGATDEVVGLQSGDNVRWTGAQLRTYLLGTTTSTLSIAAAKTLTASVTMTLQGGDASILSIAAAKTLTASASITLAGTDGKSLTLSNSGTIAGGDSWTLAIAASKSLTVSNILTLAGTDSTVMTFPSTSATIARTDAGNTFTGNQLVTGSLTAKSGLAIPAAGAGSAALLVSATANFGVFFGSGSPNTALTAAKGSFYLRSDGTGTSDRAYINTDGSTAWTAIATAG
jgi:hypothetical protein